MVINITYFLEDLSRLDELSVTELETLVETYPFDQTIRLLWHKKMEGLTHFSIGSSIMMQDKIMLTPEYSTILVSYANETGNQNPLPKTMASAFVKTGQIPDPESESQSTEVSEDFEIELRSVDKIVEKEVSVQISEPTETFESEIITNEPDQKESIMFDTIELLPETEEKPDLVLAEKYVEINQNPDEMKQQSVEDITPEEESITEKYQKLADDRIVNGDENKIKEKKKKKKKKKSDKFGLKNLDGVSEFSLWLKSLTGSNLLTSSKQNKSKYSAVKESVKKSVTKSEQIASESLAMILAAQGHISESIKMYDRLIVLNPEKSVYFAAKIEELLKSKEE